MDQARATGYGVTVGGLSMPCSIDLVEGGWAACLSAGVEDGALRFVGEPMASPPALTLRFSTFEGAGAAYEFVRLMGAAEGGGAGLSRDWPRPARHEVEFVMEGRTDPVSAMRVATSVLYEVEGTRGHAVLRAALDRVRSEPVRADPSDGTDYREAFAALLRGHGGAEPAAVVGRPRQRTPGSGRVEVMSGVSLDCGVRHRLDELAALGDGAAGVRGFVVIPTTDSTRSGNGRLRRAMVGMMRPAARPA